MIRIAIDAMGGDFAPDEIIKGVVLAAKDIPQIVPILVGNEQKLKSFKKISNFQIVHADEVISMNDSPVAAVKQKKRASINVAMELVKNNKADAIISAGNTGALMASALFKLGRIEGIERPAIATIFPNSKGGQFLLLDMGANVDSKPKNLLQFAQMGSVYSEHIMRVKNPRIGLLNIGSEIEKGNELTQQTYPLLKESSLNFIGHIEGGDILADKADVIVCDGFVGNVILKFGESTSHIIFSLLKEELKKNILSKAGALILRPALLNIKKRIDYDELGAAPLLGLNGIVFKAHGRAKAKAIKNALRVCSEAVEHNLAESIKKGIS